MQIHVHYYIVKLLSMENFSEIFLSFHSKGGGQMQDYRLKKPKTWSPYIEPLSDQSNSTTCQMSTKAHGHYQTQKQQFIILVASH